MLGIREGAGITIFCRKFFGLTVPKNFVGDPFCVSEKFWYRKMLGIREGAGITIFRQNCFVSQYRNISFVEEPFYVSESFGYRKILCLRGEYYNFLWKICCLTVPKKFIEEPFCVSESFGYRKILGIRGGGKYQDFPSKFFCLSSEKFRRGTLLCFRKFRVSKNIRDVRGGVSSFSVKNFFCLTVPKHFVRRGTLLCFRKFRVSKNFMPTGGILRFSIENLLSNRTENLRREPFCAVSENFWQRKSLWIRGGGGSVKIFRQNFFRLTVPKNFVKKQFSDSLISGIEKFYA